MKRKEPKTGGRIRDYLSCILKTFAGAHSGKLLLYADGLATMKKKGVTAMLHSLNAGYHTSSILRTLKREQIKLNTLKRQRIMQNGKFDKRRRYFLIIDDTAVRRYGRSVYGSGYNHSGNAGKVIWSNCLVTFQLREKKGAGQRLQAVFTEKIRSKASLRSF